MLTYFFCGKQKIFCVFDVVVWASFVFIKRKKIIQVSKLWQNCNFGLTISLTISLTDFNKHTFISPESSRRAGKCSSTDWVFGIRKSSLWWDTVCYILTKETLFKHTFTFIKHYWNLLYFPKLQHLVQAVQPWERASGAVLPIKSTVCSQENQIPAWNFLMRNFSSPVS